MFDTSPGFRKIEERGYCDALIKRPRRLLNFFIFLMGRLFEGAFIKRIPKKHVSLFDRALTSKAYKSRGD